MRCVKCDEPIASFIEPCPHCNFHGDPPHVEELAHIHWLLGQTLALEKAGVSTTRLAHHYRARQRELEIELGLRARSLTPDQVRTMNISRIHHEALLEEIDEWQSAHWLNQDAIQPILKQVRQQIRNLHRQLDEYTLPTYPHTAADELAIVEFLLQAVQEIGERNGFVSTDAQAQARAKLLAEKQELEIKLGLRAPAPIITPAPPEQIVPSSKPIAEPAPPRPPPPAPPVPLRDRFWRTLLSERTLQAMLFLGIFLLFAAALSFVFWGWKDFSAPLRVAIPTTFTFIFLALGWSVRTQTRMSRSGIALTAIAALLIPIDFYTLYVNFNIPPAHTPTFWFITSLVCLAAYVVITLVTQSALFGYLVGAAAGGAVLSLIEIGNQHFELARDWDAAALSFLVVALIAMSTRLKNRLLVMAEPFRNLALIASGAIMLLSFGGRYIDRHTYDALHYSMTISWWLGGCLFGWGAIHYRSRTLGILAALTLPIATFFAQAALFDQARISPAWHALGLALLVPIYLTVGHKLLAYRDDKILRGHGRTATGWGIALTIVSALWSLTNLTSSAAAATSHAILFGAMLWAMWLWQQPRILYGATPLALTTTAFAMTELNLSPNRFSVGWASLAIAYVLVAFRLGKLLSANSANENVRENLRHSRIIFRTDLIFTFVNAGFIIAGFALVPALLPYDGTLLAYALGNWLGLAAWSARLAHTKQPGFATDARFQWMTALPLPVWLWILFANRGPLGYDLPLALSVLAWGMVALSYWLAKIQEFTTEAQRTQSFNLNGFSQRVQRLGGEIKSSYRLPWYSVGLLVSIVAPIAAFAIVHNGFTPAICLLSTGLLYLADAMTNRQRWGLMPGAFVTAWGWAWLLDRARVSFDVITFATALLIAIYVGAGLWHTHRRSPIFTPYFFAPLYWASHTLTVIVLMRVANAPLAQLVYRAAWTDEMRLWQATSLILVGIVYASYAWSTFKERWAHAAAWLFVAGGGLIAVSYSTGTGSLAARAALGAIAMVIGERGLFWARRRTAIQTRTRAFVQLAWRLYHRPILIAGWATSVAVIGIALVRNLILLRAGRIQQIWAAIGLTMIVALYALSARMFRRARFVWFAIFLAFIPWTIMTNLGWLVAERPRTSAFAISWMILAWLAFLLYDVVRRYAPMAYARPLRMFAHLLIPFSLLWNVANPESSRITFLLAIALYALEAVRDAHRLQRDTTIPSSWRYTAFLYPALGLVPVWCVYLLNLLPGARYEHFGLMLLTFGILGLVAGQGLEQVAPRRDLARQFGLPAYLTGYIATMVGTLLVAHEPGLLTLAFLYDAFLALASAHVFKHPWWAFISATLAPFSFWLALNQGAVPGNRHGWWLLGLAAIYLALAWTLRRARLAPYSTAPLALAFALIAFALPPSSQDKVGAFWGYLGATMLYAITAIWLRQALLLTPVSALVLVPYAIGLQETIAPASYGLVLFPGALVALAIGWWLDARLGAWHDFPWSDPTRWFIALAERLLNWWALPLYVLGFGLVAASPFFTDGKPGFAALNWLLAMPIGAWAIYRFRLRVWLLATALAGHFAAYLYLVDLGWARFPADFAVRFLPVTIITTIVALIIERWRNEESPLQTQTLPGWSYPLYWLVSFDVWIAQILGLISAQAGTMISLAHALLIAVLASFWLSRGLTYASAILGIVALVQYMSTQPGRLVNAPTPLAQLTLAYGLIGYGLAFARERRPIPAWLGVWEKSLQRVGVWFSFVVLILAVVLGINLVQWTVRALFGVPFRQIVDLPTVQMIISVLALLGLLYLAASFTHRRLRVGYVAIAMLLAAWMLHAFYVQQWDGAANVQWYALPAGLYLLGVSFLEWERGNKDLARWIDYAAVVLMMGSLFWQTLLFGWSYALMLGAEGFAAFWWGSARRLRRFLYAGLMGVVLATLAQLINSLQSINQWLVFGIIGLIVVVTAILIERRIEEVKALQQMIETWE